MFFTATEEALSLNGDRITSKSIFSPSPEKKNDKGEHQRNTSDFHRIDKMCGVMVNVGINSPKSSNVPS
jgi:hypothetical protein